MPVLLVSLGTSWAVVPEAFHALPPDSNGFSAVHVLTTASHRIDEPITSVRDWFAARHPTVELTVTRVAEFDDLRSEDDHFRFEEVLFRWVIAKAPDPATRFFCLAGGFKTMSAAMQRAAGFFGAAEVFHVLADSSVKTAELVDVAIASNAVRFVRLGPEPGWPQMTALLARDFPLESEPADYVRVINYDLSDRVQNLLTTQRHLATHFPELDTLPFPALALRSPSRLEWLRQSLKPDSAGDLAWLKNLPKVELHCHLGGFATHGPDLATIRAAAKDPSGLPPQRDCSPPVGWPLPGAPTALNTYMHLGDNSGRALLRDPGCLAAQCRLLYEHLLEQHVAYAEIRCSPNNYADPVRGLSARAVLADIRAAFQTAMGAARTAHSAAPAGPSPCHVNLIIIATRKEGGDRSDISRHLSLAITAADEWRDDDTCRVVGVDLAGFEHRDTRAALFQTDFEAVHRVGLALTVHAGENDDAEGIWQAVFKLNARRLGHALHLGQSPDLLRAVADRSIALEMCPYANLQIKGYPLDAAATTASPTGRYPLLDYLRAGLRVTVNTDNIGISAASLNDNLLLAARLCPGLTRLDVLRLQRHALDAAFVSPAFRTVLLGRFAAQLSAW